VRRTSMGRHMSGSARIILSSAPDAMEDTSGSSLKRSPDCLLRQGESPRWGRVVRTLGRVSRACPIAGTEGRDLVRDGWWICVRFGRTTQTCNGQSGCGSYRGEAEVLEHVEQQRVGHALGHAQHQRVQQRRHQQRRPHLHQMRGPTTAVPVNHGIILCC
jgi:hypothetical protein